MNNIEWRDGTLILLDQTKLGLLYLKENKIYES